jgi:hypothetical protein
VANDVMLNSFNGHARLTQAGTTA